MRRCPAALLKWISADYGDAVLLTNFLHHFDQLHLRGPAEEDSCRFEARRTRRHARVRAQRGPCLAADAGIRSA